MWEYSIKVKNSNQHIISYIFSSSQKFVSSISGVSTVFKEEEYSSIIIGVSEKYKEKTQSFLTKCITRVICNYFKSDFLDRHLNIKILDEISLLAFKKALINFDKETDYYLVSKNLTFKTALYLKS